MPEWKLEIRKPVQQWKLEVEEKKDWILNHLQQSLPLARLQAISTSSWNAIFRGEGKDCQYCVKVMNEESVSVDWRIGDLDYIGRVMNALQGDGFGYVVPPVPLEDGLYACRCAGYSVMVFPWCEAFNATEEGRIQLESFIFAASPVLHELHIKGRPVARTLGERETLFPRKYGCFKWASKAASLWDGCEVYMKEIAAPAEVISNLSRARGKAGEIADRFPEFFAPAEEERTILHGDFRPENILIEHGRLRLVYDFDFLRVGIAEEDIAYSALYCSGPSWFNGCRDWEICADFIRAYQRAAQAKGQGAINPSLLEAALYWNILKELSLSFRPEEVAGRYKLLNELKDNMGMILQSCQ